MRQAVFVAGAWLCLVALGAQAGPAAHSSQVIVRVRPSFSQAEAKAALDGPDMQLERWLSPRLGIALVHMNGISVSEGLAQLSAHPALVWAQADHVTQDRLLPDDSAFGQQWSLNQASDADVDAPEAWDQNTGGTDPLGRRIVVAVVDGGMDLAHPDLSANVWSSLGEIPGNSQDDDSNGFVDDVNGWNAYNNSGTLVYNGHGTHVSGIVGARGNNLNQVCGVNWDVDLMTVCGSSTATSVALAAYNYVLEQKTRWLESGGLQGANVVATNSSFGVNYGNCSSGEYPAWNDMYDAMGAVGILSAASTMNINANVDIQGDVPTSCSSDYLITVTNTTSADLRNTSSAYGLLTIDLGAPGTQILSTHLNSGTAILSGTSMSAPHVAGAVALLHAVASDSLARLVQADPALGALVIKQLLLDGVDPLPALAGITVSGGRLNLQHAAQAAASWPPQPELTLQIERTADQRVRLNWSAVPGALGYHVESRASMDAPWNRLATQVETSWTSAQHAGSATAQYRVIAELP